MANGGSTLAFAGSRQQCGADQSRSHATTGKRALVWVWAYKGSTNSLVQSTEADGSQTGLSAYNALQESGQKMLFPELYSRMFLQDV